MHFSHALIAVLSLSASQAIAAPVSAQQGGMVARSAGFNDVIARSLDTMVEKRSLSPQEADESRHVFARYAHIASDRERSVAVVRDLSKRGILDTLVAAIAQIVNELLGTTSASSVSKRQTGTIITYTNDLLSSAVCLLESLLGVATTGCPTGAAARRDLSGASDAAGTSSTASSKASLAQMLTMIGQMLEEKGESLQSNNATMAANATSAAADAASNNSTGAALPTSTAKAGKAKTKEAKGSTAAASKRDDLALDRRQTEGVQGLLEVLRELVDAILNTLLPMSTRDESSASTTSEAAWAQPTGSSSCPPAGTPNDGMYRPGCPGYGRRDLGHAAQLSARDANMLQSMLPMLQMLLEELPSLLGNSTSTSKGSSSISSLLGSLTATASASATDAVTNAAGAAADGINTSTAASSASKAKATGTKDAPISAAKLSINTRELLEADGFQRRQTTGTDATTSDDGDDNGGSSQSGNTGGLNVSVLNNLLNGLLGNLLGGGSGLKTDALSGGDNNNGTSQDGNDGGVNVSILDNLLNGLLGGLLGTSSKRDVDHNKGGINIELLNGVLNNVLGSKHVRRAAMTYATRSLLSARADFQPVWEEVKKLADGHFHTRSLAAEHQGLVARDDLSPVWTSFRDMIDSSYNEQQQKTQRRSPKPKVDTSAFAHASAQFLKQKVFGKRDAELGPLKAAASTFAKTQMQEWTGKIKSKAH